MKDDQAAPTVVQPSLAHHHAPQTPHIHKSPAMESPAHEAVPVENNNTAALYGEPATVSMQQFKELEDECLSLRENNMKMKQQLVDSQRRERLMMRRLAAKEQELLDYVNQVAELKAVQTPGQSALKAALLDPAVNVLFQKLKQELQATQARLEETQNELAAWKFTPDSNTGKRLMAKCRLLHQENEELGKLTSNGRLAKLETELAMQKGVSEDLKKSHCDLDEVLLELEEDVEGMQNTILLMQRELKVEKERTQSVERENSRMLSVLRDKPEWLAAVKAKQEEAAAAEARLKEQQRQQEQQQLSESAERRLNGGGQMEVEMEMGDSASADPHATTPLRTRSGGEQQSSVVDVEGGRTAESQLEDQMEMAEDGAESAASAGGGCGSNINSNKNNNNGQSMVVTRKRTRSSVAVVNSVVEHEGVDEAMVVDEQEAVAVAPPPPTTNCSGKRNRRSNSSSSSSEQQQMMMMMKSAPRTRGQLQIESEKAKLEGVREMEEGVEPQMAVDEDVAGGGGGGDGENGQAPNEVCAVVHGNNGISGAGSAAEGGAVDENGTLASSSSVEALKLKMENGSSGGGGATAAVGGVDLRPENAAESV